MPLIFSVLKFVRWPWTPLDSFLHRLSRIWRILQIEEGSYEVKWLPLGIPNINHVSVRRGFLTKANLQIARNPQARVRCIVIIGNLSTRPRLFKRWIALSTGWIIIQRISITETNYAIRWIEIYPVDNAIQRLNNQAQTFLIHERHGWPRGTGSGTRFACQMQIIKSKQRETITNADRIIQLKMPFKDLSEVLFLSYEENMISDEELLLLYDEYSSKNPEFEPLISTWELAFWSPWPQLKNVLTCAVAVMLQKYFRLASVVPRTSGAYVPLMTRFNENSQLISLEKTLTYTLTISE